jgi:hypothetical protein
VNRLIVTLLSVVCAAGLCPTYATAADQPETVMVTFRAKPGAEAELERVIADHWKTANELHLVAAAPHVTLRGSEDGNKTYFIEVFTWRDASIPDFAPPAIQKIWARMNALVDSRGGRAGLRFEEVFVVD